MASIRTNYSYNLLLNISSVLFPLITAPYVARVLGPSELGLSSFALTYAAYFALVARLGSSNYGTRELAKIRDEKKKVELFLSQMMSITLINTIIASIMYIFSLIFISKFNDYFLIYFLAGFSIFLIPFGGFNWYLQGNERFKFITTRSLIFRCLSIIALFIFVKNKHDLPIYMALNVLSSFGVIFSNYYVIKKDGISLSLTIQGLGRHYKPMLILFSSSVAISVYTMMDSLMLGLLSSYSEVSYYSNSTTINKMLLSVATSLSIVAVPRLAYYFKNRDYDNINQLMTKSLSLVSFITFPMAVGIICIAPMFVPLFLGDLYIPAIIPTMILSGVIIAIGLSNLLGSQALIGLSLDKLFFKSVLTGTITNFLLNLALIPKWGATGAAIASVIAEFAVLGVEIYFIKKYTQITFLNGLSDIWKAIFGSVLFIPISFVLHHFLSGWWCIASIIGTCVIVYMFSQNSLKSGGYILLLSTIQQFVKKRQ